MGVLRRAAAAAARRGGAAAIYGGVPVREHLPVEPPKKRQIRHKPGLTHALSHAIS